ncbi:hypothetical protein [Paenibacillus sp. Leaf72]|uniref:hypothetical protein n=1 Tax=Paenibacillus sp. Leaf72 TaxID=1736234 RepID=UPI0006F3F855|nr:hypothetical protein [Paenibacillus sp. Leaf72]KQO18466.1 hypothetical protein ASF12_07615 [Paenibacillus sp. Leaf72]
MREIVEKDIQHWNKYNPTESHYSRYTPGTVASAYKIVDVYRMFTMGRWNNAFFLEEDYGHLCDKNDNISMKFVESMFIWDTLFYYNNSIDLTWQVVWYYYYVDTYELLYDEDVYNKIADKCDLPSLNALLDLRVSHPSVEGQLAAKVKISINQFFGNDTVVKMRKMYNYIKHRGCFHVDGLGSNDKFSNFSVNGLHFKMLTRQEIDLNETSLLFEQYDGLFVDYFNQLIQLLMPSDYFLKHLDFNGVLYDYQKLKDKLD